MGRKKSAVAGRAWHVLRLALMWVRKGGAFKEKLMVDLRAVPGSLKSLRASGDGSSRSLHYGQREFSLDETPVFHFKMHRPASLRHLRIPCINEPAVDFDDDDCRHFFQPESEVRYSLKADTDEDYEDSNGECSGDGDIRLCCDEEEDGGEGIDSKAAEFIATFYEQMKFLRQVSYLQYNEMLQRGVN